MEQMTKKMACRKEKKKLVQNLVVIKSGKVASVCEHVAATGIATCHYVGVLAVIPASFSPH